MNPETSNRYKEEESDWGQKLLKYWRTQRRGPILRLCQELHTGDEEGKGEAWASNAERMGRELAGFSLPSPFALILNIWCPSEALPHQLIVAVITFLTHKQKFARDQHSWVEIENSTKILFSHLSRTLKEGSQCGEEIFLGVGRWTWILIPSINVRESYSWHMRLLCGPKDTAKQSLP